MSFSIFYLETNQKLSTGKFVDNSPSKLMRISYQQIT
ncbi:MAG: hypothetical protein CI948_2997, partial [Halanaerobium sp.]